MGRHEAKDRRAADQYASLAREHPRPKFLIVMEWKHEVGRWQYLACLSGQPAIRAAIKRSLGSKGTGSPCSIRSAITRSASAAVLTRASASVAAIGEHARQFGHFADPPTVFLALDFDFEHGRRPLFPPPPALGRGRHRSIRPTNGDGPHRAKSPAGLRRGRANDKCAEAGLAWLAGEEHFAVGCHRRLAARGVVATSQSVRPVTFLSVIYMSKSYKLNSGTCEKRFYLVLVCVRAASTLTLRASTLSRWPLAPIGLNGFGTVARRSGRFTRFRPLMPRFSSGASITRS
jgi:hypothetical protein